MRAKRSLGQNFLSSEGVVERIVEAARFMASEARGIVEVGPGRGALTAGLMAMGKPLWVVELDDALAGELGARFPALRITRADARTFDWCSLSRITGLIPWLLVGNLPYNAGTEILWQALFRRDTLCGALVMLQREVARKFCSGPGEEGYGPLAVWADPWWERRLAFSVPPGAFRPQPKVTSAVCAFRARPTPGLPTSDQWAYWEFLKGAFLQRRKTLAANLAGPEAGDKGAVAATLDGLGEAATARPAEVSPEVFERLFGTFYGK
jgi:16S rRNA (adenine1518-N6/adenine1519-N6)-dimethyltransferase